MVTAPRFVNTAHSIVNSPFQPLTPTNKLVGELVETEGVWAEAMSSTLREVLRLLIVRLATFA